MELCINQLDGITAQSQPQTPASCPNRSPLSCFNTSINGPTSAVETNKILTFREVDHPTSVITSRKISQNIQSSSSAAASSLTSLTNTNRPPLSLLGILAAKRITRKFLSTLADEKHQRRLSTFSRLSVKEINNIDYSTHHIRFNQLLMNKESIRWKCISNEDGYRYITSPWGSFGKFWSILETLIGFICTLNGIWNTVEHWLAAIRNVTNGNLEQG
ncbi:unnamed protein product [Schistosoma curassoni]|nr:unnamed protein product [Schistosoma curassoni]